MDPPSNPRVLDSYESPLIARLSWESRRMQMRVAFKRDFGNALDVRRFHFCMLCMAERMC